MKNNRCWQLGICISIICNLSALAFAAPPSILSDDPCNAKWHLEPQSRTILFVGEDTHPTRIALLLSELSGFQLSVDSDANQFTIMSGLVTINGVWNSSGKNTLTMTAVGDSPSLLINGKEIPAYKGRWAAIALNNKDRQVLLEFPGAGYANLKYSLGASTVSAEPANAAKTTRLSFSELKAQLADAENKLETAKQDLQEQLAKNSDYQTASQHLDVAKKAMQTANQDGDPDEITKAATEEMNAQAAVDHFADQYESNDASFKALNDQIAHLRVEITENGPLATRKFWHVTVIGKPAMDNTALMEQIRTTEMTLRELGPTETPYGYDYGYYGRHSGHLTAAQQDTINAANTRNTERTTAQLKLQKLQKELAERQTARLITATVEGDNIGASIYASGSAATFADTMEIGRKYTVLGSANMLDGALRINLSSAVPDAPAQANNITP